MREAGFAAVSSAAGERERSRQAGGRPASRPKRGCSTSPARSAPAISPRENCCARGITRWETVLIYRAVIAEQLPPHAAAALAAGLDGVLHFSRRSAEAYVTASRNAGLQQAALQGPVQFCLSARVAEPLTQAGATTVRIAARPDEAALIDLCGR